MSGVSLPLLSDPKPSHHQSLKSHGPLHRDTGTKAHRLRGAHWWGFLPVHTQVAISLPHHPHAALGKPPAPGPSCVEPPGVGLVPSAMPKVLPGELGAAR